MLSTAHTASVDGIPVLWMNPAVDTDRRSLAIWMTGLTGWKELTEPTLARLADLGFLALSIDAFEHGERLRDTREALARRADSAFRETVWPILGRTVLDLMRVADWAISAHDLDAHIVAGGISLGGDIAVALAGVDQRVDRVAAIASTPDWARPGMRRNTEPYDVVAQGMPGAEGAWLRGQLDPALHSDRFATGPAIAFELGEDDEHIPPRLALAFARSVADAGNSSADRVTVTVHPGLDHAKATADPGLLARAIAWLARES